MTDPVRLQRLRAEVDDIDLQLVQLMAARQRLVEAVAAVKGDVRRVRDRAGEPEAACCGCRHADG